jgi:hypothetical protein
MEYDDRDDEGKMYFRFSLNRDNGDTCTAYASTENVSVSYSYLGDTTWNVVLRDFVRFLGMVYGYDIDDQVKIEAPFTVDKKEDDKQMSFMWGKPEDMEDTE